MNRNYLILLFFTFILFNTSNIFGQGIKIREVLLLNHVQLKTEVKPEAFQSFVNKDLAPTWNKTHPNSGIDLFRADRGVGKGQFLLVSSNPSEKKRSSAVRSSDNKSLPVSSRLTEYLTNPNSFIEYRLIGADHFKTLPTASILGIHYIQVKPDRAAGFEKFVVEKLHPALGQLLPDMQ